MSVINQMLKDLEHRQANGAHGVDMFRLLKVGPEFSNQSNINLGKLLLFILLSIVVAFVINIWRNVPAGINPNSSSSSFLSTKTSVNHKPMQTEPALIYEVPSTKEDARYSGIASIENINIKDVGGVFRIEIESLSSLYASVERKDIDGGTVQYRINDSLLKAGVPAISFNNQYMKSISIEQKDDVTILNIALADNMISTFNEMMPLEYKGYRLSIEIKPNPIARKEKLARSADKVDPSEMQAIAPKETMSIRKVSAEKMTGQSSYHRGMALLKSGRADPAISHFEQALQYAPALVDARIALVSLYLQQGRHSEAGIALEEGINLDPYNAELANIYAKLLVDGNAYEKAISILKAAEEGAKRNPEYLALIAAVSQRLARHDDAVQYYVKALDLQADKSIWWVGMAISLEGLKKDKEADKAYREAKKRGLLDAELIKYVNARIKHLNA